MDFDPGELYDEDDLHDSYEEGCEDGQIEFDPELDAEVEYDDDGNLMPLLATAAGFGYHMATDELEERKLAESILKRKEGKQGEPIKVPLARRKETKGHMTPFGRWATRANIDHKKTEDELEYTKEEQLQILKSEGDWDG